MQLVYDRQVIRENVAHLSSKAMMKTENSHTVRLQFHLSFMLQYTKQLTTVVSRIQPTETKGPINSTKYSRNK